MANDNGLRDKYFLFIIQLLIAFIGTLLFIGYNQITSDIGKSKEDIQALKRDITILQTQQRTINYNRGKNESHNAYYYD